MKIKTINLAILFCAFLFCAVAAFSQANYYSVQLWQLPVNSMAPNTVTNFGNGWPSIASSTNITTTWTGFPNVPTYATNVITATNNAFCVLDKTTFKDSGIQVNYQAPGASGSLILTLATSNVFGQPATLGNFTWTIPATATNSSGYVIGSTNIPAAFAGGIGYLYVTQMQWTDASVSVTNIALLAAKKICY